MNNIKTIAFLAALNAKRVTLTERIIRYTAYVAADKALIEKSEKHARKYASRLRNHEMKLERYKNALAKIEATLAANA